MSAFDFGPGSAARRRQVSGFHRPLLAFLATLATTWPLSRARAAPPTPAAPSPEVSVGARAFFAPSTGVAGALGVGLEGAYALIPPLAVGVQATTFYVDQGNDAERLCAHCLFNGTTLLAFAEGRLAPTAVLTPYARAALGVALLEGQVVAGTQAQDSETLPAFGGELGLEVGYRMASLRVFGFETISVGSRLGGNHLAGLGFQVGARF